MEAFSFPWMCHQTFTLSENSVLGLDEEGEGIFSQVIKKETYQVHWCPILTFNHYLIHRYYPTPNFGRKHNFCQMSSSKIYGLSDSHTSVQEPANLNNTLSQNKYKNSNTPKVQVSGLKLSWRCSSCVCVLQHWAFGLVCRNRRLTACLRLPKSWWVKRQEFVL